MRKIVIKKTVTNIILVAIVFGGVIYGIMLYPLISYLMQAGLTLRDSMLIGLCIANPIMMILFRLAVKLEGKGVET